MRINSTIVAKQVNYNYQTAQYSSVKDVSMSITSSQHDNTSSKELAFCGIKEFFVGKKPRTWKPKNPSDYFSSDELEKIKKCFDKLLNFSADEYKALSSEEIEILRKAYKRMRKPSDIYSPAVEDLVTMNYITYDEVIAIHKKAVKLIKESLDKKYGEGNYVLILPGRSLSSIGKCLGYKIGENNVKNIPLSRAYMYSNKRFLKQLYEEGAIKQFNKFLETLGLTKETVQNSAKKYIITDYCASGGSLFGTKDLLTSEYVLGQNNIETVDIWQLISDKIFAMRLDKMLCGSEFKELSNLKYCADIRKAQECVGKNKENKLLLFKLLDEQMK